MASEHSNNIDLDVYNKFLSKVSFKPKGGLLLSWGAETGACNIAWIRVVSLNWHWPFFHLAEFFQDKHSDKYWIINTWGVSMD